MARIKIEVSALRRNEKTLDEQITQLNGLGNRLNGLIGRIEGSWEGKTSTAYVRMMRLYADQTGKMCTVLRAYKGYVNTAATTFEEIDKKAASRINGAF